MANAREPAPANGSRPRRMGLWLGLTLWLGGIVAGFCALQSYATRAGPVHPPQAAAEFIAQHQKPGRPLIVLAVHPRCPCTAASLAEMGDLLARSHGACDALILQYHPQAELAGWSTGPAQQELGGAKIPVLIDRGGKMAAAIGATTSGHVLFADAHGAVRFTGGLTISRGHRGRAPGQDAILALLAGAESALTSAPVYGCALEAACGEENCP